MVIVGIDPGLTGAVAFHSAGQWSVVDCPTVEVKSGKSIKNRPDPLGMASILYSGVGGEDAMVYIERVGAMPKQGVTSSFNFGMGYGMWLGCVAALKLPYTFVSPQVWKKPFGLLGQPKDASRQKARQLFPYLVDALNLKKHDGRSDAILIGEYGAQQQRN